jgi:hypothetical protein
VATSLLLFFRFLAAGRQGLRCRYSFRRGGSSLLIKKEQLQGCPNDKIKYKLTKKIRVQKYKKNDTTTQLRRTKKEPLFQNGSLHKILIYMRYIYGCKNTKKK